MMIKAFKQSLLHNSRLLLVTVVFKTDTISGNYVIGHFWRHLEQIVDLFQLVLLSKDYG